MSAKTLSNPILQAPAPFEAAVPELSWRWLHVAVGQEMFGRRAGPWGIVFAPVPLAALGVLLLSVALPGEVLGRVLVGRLQELAYMGLAPFLLAAAGQAAVLGISDVVWRVYEGDRHVDYSPRVWHTYAAAVLALLPLLLLQFSDDFLDLYLRLGLWFDTMFGSAKVPLAGYDPGWSHLLALVVLPLIYWQVQRVMVKIPCGRILGFQRELARLRGAVAWEPDAWAMAIADTFDRWMEDLAPPDADRQPIANARVRQHRQRWGGLRKEVLASWIASPPDLARANRALRVYREGW